MEPEDHEDDDEKPEPGKVDDDLRAGIILLSRLKGGLAFNVVSEEYGEDAAKIVHGKVKLKLSETDVETSAFGLIFMLAILSFKDALPAGYSKTQFQFEDEFKVADLVAGLRYWNGRLNFYADYVRGRLMKTAVDIDKDGNVVIQTVNRDKLAGRWVEILSQLKMEDDEGEERADGEAK